MAIYALIAVMYSISEASGVSESGFSVCWKSAVLMVIQINHALVVSPQARSLVKQIEEWSELG